MDDSLLQEYAALDSEKADLKQRMAKIQERLTHLEPMVIEELINLGSDNLTVMGRKITIRNEVYSKFIDKSRAAAALKAAGLGDLVTESFHRSTLDAVIRDYLREERPLPAEFDGVIGYSEVSKVRTGKA